VKAIAAELHGARIASADRFASAVAAELRGIGLGDGEFHVELAERELGSTGTDAVTFLIRPNPGLPFAPVAETASGGELSRIHSHRCRAGGKMTLSSTRSTPESRPDLARGRTDAPRLGGARRC
jgi:hypothetical protein